MAIIKIGNPAIDLDAAEIPNLDTAKITTGTLADARLPANALNSNIDLTNLSASNLTSGTVATARLGTGTADATTFLRGDNTFAVPSGGGGGGGGITDIEQWRITSSATGNFPNGLTANWSRVAYNDTVYGYFSTGSGITQSSGIFSFPSTGYWLINFTPNIYGKADDRLIYIRGETSTNGGSTWSQTGNIGASSDAGTVFSGNQTGFSGTWERILDITDIAQQKIKFCVEFNFGGSTNIVGNTTTATFLRLGDT